jgi:transposase InsO family protein
MNVYGSIIPGATTLARLLPEGTREARKPRPASREARHRQKVLDWHEEHGGKASLTARHFGCSRSTVYALLKRSKDDLEDRSRRPKRVRRPTWSDELEAMVLKLRQDNPRWGKDMLTPILRRDGVEVSVSMVGRILSKLKREGRLLPATLKDPCIVSRPQIRPYAVRMPKDYLVQAPGDLVQVDTADVRYDGSARIYKHFGGRDYIARWDVLDVHGKATAHNAAAFLDTLEARMPFKIRGIQIDGGSEFRGEFEAACQAKGIRLFVLPPRSPKLNGRIERINRTHKEEFYELVDPTDSLAELRALLLKQEQRYNTYRPHQALGYLTPQEWLLAFAERG